MIGVLYRQRVTNKSKKVIGLRFLSVAFSKARSFDKNGVVAFGSFSPLQSNRAHMVAPAKCPESRGNMVCLESPCELTVNCFSFGESLDVIEFAELCARLISNILIRGWIGALVR